MCSYIGIKVSKTQYVQLKKIEKKLGQLASLKPVQSGFEYTDWEIVIPNNDSFKLVKAHWEFIPSFIKNSDQLVEARKKGIPWLNARAETILTSKMFADAAIHRRCLIPISWFFEWKHLTPAGSKKNHTFPHIISVTNEEVFYLAGIWQPWINTTGENQYTFAIVTTAANTLMAEIHNVKKRMPTILPKQLAEKWLEPNLTDKEIAEIASFQIPSESLVAHTIGPNFKTDEDPSKEYLYNELVGLF